MFLTRDAPKHSPNWPLADCIALGDRVYQGVKPNRSRLSKEISCRRNSGAELEAIQAT